MPSSNEAANRRQPTSKKSLDLIVIGAGLAGFSAATSAATQGAKVALVSDGPLGGTSINVGCIPSKAMIHAANGLAQGRAMSSYGSALGQSVLADWKAIIESKDQLLSSMRNAAFADRLSNYPNIEFVVGNARLFEQGVTVNGRQIAAHRTIIASGSTPALPHIPGADKVAYLTSTTAMALDKLPDSLIIVGGGYVGCEMAQMFARFGVRVTLLTRDRLMPAVDPEISATLTERLQDQGINIHTMLRYRSICGGHQQVSLTYVHKGQEQTVVAEKVLFAAGRRPNTAGLALKHNGVDTSPSGYICVDRFLRTRRADVYAAGDVTGADQFAYMASYAGELAAANALNGDKKGYSNGAVPWVLFTDPRVAAVGLTESQARAKRIDVVSSLVPLSRVPHAVLARDVRGLIKLIADASTDRLIGAQMIVPDGADAIQTAALAIRQGMTTAQLASALFPHLTLVEGLQIAARQFASFVPSNLSTVRS